MDYLVSKIVDITCYYFSMPVRNLLVFQHVAFLAPSRRIVNDERSITLTFFSQFTGRTSAGATKGTTS